MAYKAGVMGAAGYAGVELVRLLANHPDFTLSVITSDSEAGSPLQDTYPAFFGADVPAFTGHDDPALTECDVVFLAVPHTVSLKYTPKLLAAGVTVVDLSADYRLADPAVYEQWYQVPHTSPELLATRAFGLPELFGEELAQAAAKHQAGEAVLVACAGCYPTATSLAAAPLMRTGLTQGVVVVDAISGVTGAGKKPSARTHFCSANENAEAYGVGKHRHTPEIEQILDAPGRVLFTPHLAPLSRGLLSTVTMQLSPDAKVSAEWLQSMYEDFYAGQPCVQVLPQGTLAKTSSVVGTVRAHVSVVYHETTNCVVALGAIDNLCKGAAGQAVQCANVLFGLNQTQGLPLLGMAV
ncbi:MAG: N-acetyl-gamma-glutamyl-phosphate reductase [Eggerthellales bacterium]|nr:N-acetyl-gamma-glutamyl-phosphate reductase [Eggerthellales bacterium]